MSFVWILAFLFGLCFRFSNTEQPLRPSKLSNKSIAIAVATATATFPLLLAKKGIRQLLLSSVSGKEKQQVHYYIVYTLKLRPLITHWLGKRDSTTVATSSFLFANTKGKDRSTWKLSTQPATCHTTLTTTPQSFLEWGRRGLRDFQLRRQSSDIAQAASSFCTFPKTSIDRPSRRRLSTLP